MDPIHSLHFLSIQVYHMKRNPIMRAVVTAKLGKTTEAAASQLDGSWREIQACHFHLNQIKAPKLLIHSTLGKDESSISSSLCLCSNQNETKV
jgi:hypothetical protein